MERIGNLERRKDWEPRTWKGFETGNLERGKEWEPRRGKKWELRTC